MNNKDGFKTGSGCFTCNTCGKKTRLGKYHEMNGSCSDCNLAFEIENGLEDGTVNETDLEFLNVQINKWKLYQEEKENGTL